MVFLIGYIIIGIVLVVIEHSRYDWDGLEDMTLALIALNVLQQTIHYSRYLLTWPWYVLEDMVIVAANWIEENEE